ncbi:Peroxiredoxin OsmC [compost metagenome]
MKRQASARWKGNLKQGRGEISTQSGVLKSSPYSFGTRFEESPGTNPEELIAAAHAGCFSMALAGELNKQGFTPDVLDVSAEVSIDKKGEGFEISTSHLKLKAQVPGIDQNAFRTIAEGAKANCPVSKVLRAEISLDIEFQPSERQSESRA